MLGTALRRNDLNVSPLMTSHFRIEDGATTEIFKLARAQDSHDCPNRRASTAFLICITRSNWKGQPTFRASSALRAWTGLTRPHGRSSRHSRAFASVTSWRGLELYRRRRAMVLGIFAKGRALRGGQPWRVRFCLQLPDPVQRCLLHRLRFRQRFAAQGSQLIDLCLRLLRQNRQLLSGRKRVCTADRISIGNTPLFYPGWNRRRICTR